MKTIIGYTDSINECDCCGKINLKGTYCIDLDGVELYYGSMCAFKNHGLTTDEQKELKATFTKGQKNSKLIEIHIAPLREQLAKRIENTFTTNYENLTELAKKIYRDIECEYNRVINLKAKKYKIILNN
jgi:hypothetical protein